MGFKDVAVLTAWKRTAMAAIIAPALLFLPAAEHGAQVVTPVAKDPVPVLFYMADSAGTVWAIGGPFNAIPDLVGVPTGEHLSAPVVDIVPTVTGKGYWMVTSSGQVLARGDAHSYPRVPGGPPLTGQVADITPTPGEKGYWLVGKDGVVAAYGGARNYGPNGPFGAGATIIRLVPTPDAKGYWLLGRGGAIYPYGDAHMYGSESGKVLSHPIVDMASTVDGKGYWLLGAGGTVYPFGDAHNYGSAPVPAGSDPAEKIVVGPSGKGYWVEDQNGTAVPLGGATDYVGYNISQVLAPGQPPVAAVLFTPETPGDKAVLFALSQLGKPYAYGGDGPNSYDCSGLVQQSWHAATGKLLPHNAAAQYASGTPVPYTQVRTGDILFWASNPAKEQTIGTDALYVGGGMVVQSEEPNVQIYIALPWDGDGMMPHAVRPAA